MLIRSTRPGIHAIGYFQRRTVLGQHGVQRGHRFTVGTGKLAEFRAQRERREAGLRGQFRQVFAEAAIDEDQPRTFCPGQQGRRIGQ